jgi:hypothetical protein
LTRALLPLALFALLAATAYAPAPEPRTDRPAAPGDTDRWAWPENPTNLQVIPQDIGAERLRFIMQNFTRSLGVRCSFCHVGQGDFLNWDFASDANPHKEVARDMMRMTRELNQETLAGIEGLHEVEEGAFRVTCWTCHRGNATPETSPPPEPDEAAPAEPPAPADTPAPPADGHPHPPGQQHQH